MNAPAPVPADPLPASIEAEQAVLGALLLNQDALAYVIGVLEARHFYEETHRLIYQTIVDIAAAGKPATLIPIGLALASVEFPATAPPIRQYLARLCADALPVHLARGHAELIVDQWARREVIALASAAADAARAPGPGQLQAALDGMDAAIIDLRNSASAGVETERSNLSDGLADVIQDAEDKAAGTARAIPSSGFVDLDKAIGGGLRPGRLIIVAGNTGAGKTVVLVAMARRVARLRDDRPQFGVEVFSLEIDRREFSARAAANAMGAGTAPLDYGDILAGRVDEQGLHRLREVQAKFSDFAMTIDATPGLSIEQIESRAKRTQHRLARAGKTLDVVFIDYLQIMGFGDRYRGRKVDEIGEVTKAAKNMAKRLGVCVVLLSQLNRANQARDDKRPQLSDLRDSGSIEQDADVVIGLHRPAYYDQRDPKVMRCESEALQIAAGRANDLELILMKNRLGPTASITLYCDVAKCFVDNGRRKW